MNTVNTEALRISDAICAEEKRAARDGITIAVARNPRDTYLAGWLDACNHNARIARTIESHGMVDNSDSV
jgi:hypothetical protein